MARDDYPELSDEEIQDLIDELGEPGEPPPASVPPRERQFDQVATVTRAQLKDVIAFKNEQARQQIAEIQKTQERQRLQAAALMQNLAAQQREARAALAVAQARASAAEAEARALQEAQPRGVAGAISRGAQAVQSAITNAANAIAGLFRRNR